MAPAATRAIPIAAAPQARRSPAKAFPICVIFCAVMLSSFKQIRETREQWGQAVANLPPR